MRTQNILHATPRPPAFHPTALVLCLLSHRPNLSPARPLTVHPYNNHRPWRSVMKKSSQVAENEARYVGVFYINAREYPANGRAHPVRAVPCRA